MFKVAIQWRKERYVLDIDANIGISVAEKKDVWEQDYDRLLNIGIIWSQVVGEYQRHSQETRKDLRWRALQQ